MRGQASVCVMSMSIPRMFLVYGKRIVERCYILSRLHLLQLPS